MAMPLFSIPCIPRTNQHRAEFLFLFVFTLLFVFFIKLPLSFAETSAPKSSASISTLEAFNISKNGTKVRAEGLVVVPFGIIKQSMMYVIASSTASTTQPTIPVYLSRKNKPTLGTGEVIKINATIAIVRDEKVLKVTDAQFLTIISTQSLPRPSPVAIGSLSNQNEGNWLTVQGRILKINSKSYSVGDESSRVLIYGKLPSSAPPKKSLIQATGFFHYKGLDPTITVVQREDVSVIEDARARPTTTAPQATSSLPAVPQESPRVRWWYIATVPIAAGIGFLLKRFVIDRV